MTSGARFWRALWVVGFCACAVPRVGEPAPRLHDAAAEHAYREILTRYTGRGEIYGGAKIQIDPNFDTRLFAAATLQSWPFRQARAQRIAVFRAESEAELEKRLTEERAQWNAANVLLLGVHVNEPRFDDFDRSDSIWRLALITPAGEVTASHVRRVGRANLALRALYNYLDDFWVAYEVQFPKNLPDGRPLLADEISGPVTLRISSTLGKTDLKIPGH